MRSWEKSKAEWAWNERAFKNPWISERLIMKSSQQPTCSPSLHLTPDDPPWISFPNQRWDNWRSEQTIHKCFFHKQLSRASTQTLRGLLISSLQTLRRVIVAVKALLRSHYDATDSWDFERLITQTSQAAIALINGFVSALMLVTLSVFKFNPAGIIITMWEV